jgi:pentatricopeptide repeat domain-containing protein 1
MAVILLGLMPKAMTIPDNIIYKATIGACEKSGQGKRRNTFLNLMPEARVVLNEFIYSATISACEKGGQSIWH